MAQKNNDSVEIILSFILFLILIFIIVNPFLYPLFPFMKKLNGILIAAAFVFLYLFISYVGAKKPKLTSTIEGVWYNEENDKFISIDRNENELLVLKGIIKSEDPGSILKKMTDGSYNIISKELPSGLEFVDNVKIQYDKENDTVTINSIGLSNLFTRTTDYKIPAIRTTDYFML